MVALDAFWCVCVMVTQKRGIQTALSIRCSNLRIYGSFCWLRLRSILPVMALLSLIATRTAAGCVTAQAPIVNAASSRSLPSAILFLILPDPRNLSLFSATRPPSYLTKRCL